jgi:hypothetical protein
MMCPHCNYYGNDYGKGSWCNKAVTIGGFTYVGLNLQTNQDGEIKWSFAEDCPAFDDSRHQERFVQWLDTVSAQAEIENSLENLMGDES